MSQAVEFCFDLSNRDLDIMRTLKTILEIEHRDTFSADDIFLFGLDRYFPKSEDGKNHAVGGWFAKMFHHGIFEKAGRKRSTRACNNFREMWLYRFAKREGLK